MPGSTRPRAYRWHPSPLPGSHRGWVNKINKFRYEPQNPGRSGHPYPGRSAGRTTTRIAAG
ncbi:hypothetical protein A0257_23025 (plasmid) [Hymenobacter psoromatis]|nr:hypothetical protein A0257_23025 [Hymenobacter psoromatis]